MKRVLTYLQCYLRLSSPEDARILINHFTSRKFSQKDALDAVPFSVDENYANPVSLQLVEGTRESFYWDKVPEKIRKAAVLKALKKDDGTKGKDDNSNADLGNKTGLKKRRRHR